MVHDDRRSDCYQSLVRPPGWPPQVDVRSRFLVPTSRSASVADRSTPPRSSSRQQVNPWRVRPPDFNPCAKKTPATTQVAHAPRAGCHRLRGRAQTAPQDGQIVMAFLRWTGAVCGALPPWFSDSDSAWLTPREGPRPRAVVGAVRERQVVSRNRWSIDRCPRGLLSQVFPHRRLEG